MSLILKNEEIYLRPIRLSDAKEMYVYAKTPGFGPKADWEPHKSIEETKAIIRNLRSQDRMGQSKNFCIRRITDNKMLGTCEIFRIQYGERAEVGYSIRPEENNKGYATMATKLVCDFGFKEYNLKRIEAISFVDNIASHRVCEKCGFINEGVKEKGYITYDKQVVDIQIMALVK